MNFPPPPSAFFYWRAIERQSRGKKSKREKSNYFSKKFAARGNYFHVRVYFITVQRNFHSFFCSLVVKSMMMVWLKAKAIAINVCKFSLSLLFRINLTFSCSLYFHATTLFYELSRTKNPRVFMSSLKLFHFHVMPHKNFSTAILNSNHVGGLN